MRVSLNWLNDYIDIKDLSIETLTSTLTNLGLEVESVESIEPWSGDVVVGRIESAQPHPNAEKLQICTVQVGEKDPLSIVCGAPNARAGLIVAVAKVGSVLPGDLKIKSSKIRGEPSFGMLCSGQELGLSSDHDGIIELSPEWDIGSPLAELFQLRDTVIELSITPNRADCLGYVGIARDLSAKLGRKLKLPEIPEAIGEASLKSEQMVKVEVNIPEDCARFTALYLDQVKVATSPLWLQKRLENSGMRPINAIVDATNYVMLETGQPIHAYDLRDIKGGLIKVRRAYDQEKLTTLDGTSRQLTLDDIVISDEKVAIGLAGIMGGENSEVKSDTSQLVIEVAHFNASRVRKSAKRYGIHSEASHRFERGVDIHNLAYVNKRVAVLISQLMTETGSQAPVRIASSIVDIGTTQPALPRIALRMDRVRQVTGLSTINQLDCIDYLEKLGCKFLDKTDERILFEIPSWRLDIMREIDLIEEIARIHGYEHIPYSLPLMEIGGSPENPFIEFMDQAKSSLAEAGFTEIISFPFASNQDFEFLQIPSNHPFYQRVSLANPLVEDQKYLRTTLMISLLKALVENRRHGVVGAKLFESACNFYELHEYAFPQAYESFKPVLVQGAHIIGKGREENRPVERSCLAGVIDQPYQVKTWDQSEIKASFFHGKAAVTKLLSDFGIQNFSFERPEPEVYPWIHPAASAVVKAGEKDLGYIGELHPKVARSFEFDYANPPIVFELELELLWQKTLENKTYGSSTVRFPPVTRDIAIVVDEAIRHFDVVESLTSFSRRKFLSDFHLFDVYRGDRLGEGKKSLAYSLKFLSPKKTLTDQEVEKELTALLDHLKESIAAELR